MGIDVGMKLASRWWRLNWLYAWTPGIRYAAFWSRVARKVHTSYYIWIPVSDLALRGCILDVRR